jgi:hypothetical protein
MTELAQGSVVLVHFSFMTGSCPGCARLSRGVISALIYTSPLTLLYYLPVQDPIVKASFTGCDIQR